VHTTENWIVEWQLPCSWSLVERMKDGFGVSICRATLQRSQASHLPSDQSCGALAGKLRSSPTCAKPFDSPLVHALTTHLRVYACTVIPLYTLFTLDQLSPPSLLTNTKSVQMQQ
jgi:hypothetical protein